MCVNQLYYADLRFLNRRREKQFAQCTDRCYRPCRQRVIYYQRTTRGDSGTETKRVRLTRYARTLLFYRATTWRRRQLLEVSTAIVAPLHRDSQTANICHRYALGFTVNTVAIIYIYITVVYLFYLQPWYVYFHRN